MLTPSLLLTDEGDGCEFITVLATDFQRTDPVGNVIPYPSDSGKQYPAVVNPTDASLMFANAADESVNNYDIVIYSIENPGILVDDRLVWSRDNTPMVAQGVSVPVGRGAWGLRAVADIQAVDEPMYHPQDEDFPNVDQPISFG